MRNDNLCHEHEALAVREMPWCFAVRDYVDPFFPPTATVSKKKKKTCRIDERMGGEGRGTNRWSSWSSMVW